MRTYLMASVLALACATPALAQSDNMASKKLTTNFVNNNGKNIGTATLMQTPNGVLIQTNLHNLPMGKHAMHIHKTGKCDVQGDFQSAGDHYAPGGNEHGFKSENGPHAGDLPNQVVDRRGRLRADILAPAVTLEKGAKATLLDNDGSALVIHSDADDYQTQPAGDSGDRIACAVISDQSEQAMNGQSGNQNQRSQSSAMSDNEQNESSSQQRGQRTAALENNNQTQSDITPTAVSLNLIYTGWSARDLIGQDVYGSNQNDLGEIQDLIVDPKGKVKSIVVEGGGFLDIGNSTFRIPLSDVDMTPGKDGVSVTVSEQQAENRGWYDEPEAVSTGPREFRVNQLIGEYARLKDGKGFGYVSDVVFGKNGKIMAVLVDRDKANGGGTYGYPYYGYNGGWRPGADRYALPFSSLEMASQAPQVDKSKLEDNS